MHHPHTKSLSSPCPQSELTETLCQFQADPVQYLAGSGSVCSGLHPKRTDRQTDRQAGIQTLAYKYNIHTSLCACTCVYMCVHVCTCMCVHLCTCVYMHVSTCVYMHVCTSVYMCVHACVYMCVHVCIVSECTGVTHGWCVPTTVPRCMQVTCHSPPLRKSCKSQRRLCHARSSLCMPATKNRRAGGECTGQ